MTRNEVESRAGAQRRRWLHRLCAISAWLHQRGDTIEEALANIREAIELYLEPVEDDWVLAENAIVEELVV